MQYIKIKDAILEQIEAGMLSPRQKLPAERQLAQSFNTTRVTLREALSLLEAEKRIYREDRRGWFIAGSPLRYDLTAMSDFTQIALAQQRVPTTQLLSAQTMVANTQAAQLLSLAPFSQVFCVERLCFLEQRPVMYVQQYIRCDLFPNLLDYELSNSLSKLYADHFGMENQWCSYRISSRSLSAETAQWLRATSGSTAMVVARLHRNAQGVVMACDTEYWRQDAISLESQAAMLSGDVKS